MRTALPFAVMLVGALATAPAFAECTPRDVLCAEEVSVNPTDARSFLESELGQSLPKDIAITSFLEGGFQDLFIEVELTGSPQSIMAMLRLLQIDPNAMEKDDASTFGLSSDPIWSLKSATGIRSAEGRLGSFAVVRAAVPSSPSENGPQRLFLVAFKI